VQLIDIYIEEGMWHVLSTTEGNIDPPWTIPYISC